MNTDLNVVLSWPSSVPQIIWHGSKMWAIGNINSQKLIDMVSGGWMCCFSEVRAKENRFARLVDISQDCVNNKSLEI